MKLLVSLSWFVLVIASPPSVFAMVATTKKTTKHAKKNKTSDWTSNDGTSNDGTSNGFVPVIEPPGLDLNCDPSQESFLDKGNGCEDNDCADTDWLDGCEACMCFNNGNAAWCDGTRGDFYDKYFEEHGDNPWGDRNVRNRKCNTEFLPEMHKCLASWQCATGLWCVAVSNDDTMYPLKECEQRLM